MVTMVIVFVPQDLGLWDPFHESWPVNHGGSIGGPSDHYLRPSWGSPSSWLGVLHRCLASWDLLLDLLRFMADFLYQFGMLKTFQKSRHFMGNHPQLVFFPPAWDVLLEHVPGKSAIVTFLGWWVKTWPELKGCWWPPSFGDEKVTNWITWSVSFWNGIEMNMSLFSIAKSFELREREVNICTTWWESGLNWYIPVSECWLKLVGGLYIKPIFVYCEAVPF